MLHYIIFTGVGCIWFSAAPEDVGAGRGGAVPPPDQARPRPPAGRGQHVAHAGVAHPVHPAVVLLPCCGAEGGAVGGAAAAAGVVEAEAGLGEAGRLLQQARVTVGHTIRPAGRRARLHSELRFRPVPRLTWVQKSGQRAWTRVTRLQTSRAAANISHRGSHPHQPHPTLPSSKAPSNSTRRLTVSATYLFGSHQIKYCLSAPELSWGRGDRGETCAV